jgi:hypothetical protein
MHGTRHERPGAPNYKPFIICSLKPELRVPFRSSGTAEIHLWQSNAKTRDWDRPTTARDMGEVASACHLCLNIARVCLNIARATEWRER